MNINITNESTITIVYWVFQIICIGISFDLFFNFNGYLKEVGRKVLFPALSVLCIIICLGPMHRTFTAIGNILFPEPIEEKQEYETNTTLPIGCYYLGCEIVEVEGYIENGVYQYIYTFSSIDDVNTANYNYTYQTTEALSDNIPYLLTMDSMGTNAFEDDEVIVVWACVY